MSRGNGKAILLGVTMFLNTLQGAAQRNISRAEAHGLILALLKPGGWTKLRGFDLVDEDLPGHAGYYFISAIHDNPGGGNAIGHYAIDSATGDVSDWVICGGFESSSLAKAQEALRERIGLDRAQYRKLKRHPPGCEPSENPTRLKMGRPAW